MGHEEFSRRWEAGQQLIQANGVTYNVYGDPRGSARPWPMDLMPLAIDARRMGAHRTRGHPARHAAQHHPGGSLRHPPPGSRRTHPARASLRQPQLPAPLPRHQAAGRGVPAQLRRGHRTGAERPVVGDLGPHAVAVRRRLRAREPSRERAHAADDSQPVPRAIDRSLLRGDDQGAAGPGAATAGQPARRRADLRAEQRNLLRAFVLRSAVGLPARRRRRSHGARPARLPQDARGPESGGRHSAPPGRRLLRSARTARRLAARRAGPGSGRARRQRVHRQLSRQRPRRDAGADGVPATALPSHPRRRPAHAVGGDLVVRPGRAAATGARLARPRGDQARVPAIRAARRVSSDDDRRGARRARGPHRGAARPVRRAGAGRSLDDAGAQPSRARASARGASRDRRVGRYVVRGAAGRPDARGHRPAVARRLDAARRRQQRHVGDGPHRASPDRTAAGRSAGHATSARRSCPAASPTISSGWAGTPSVSRPRRASRARCCQASRANRSRAGQPRSRRSCTSSAASTCCQRSTGTRSWPSSGGTSSACSRTWCSTPRSRRASGGT